MAVKVVKPRPGPKAFSSGVIIDADYSDHGWEIVVRLYADSAEQIWTGVNDAGLKFCVGHVLAGILISERDRS